MHDIYRVVVVFGDPTGNEWARLWDEGKEIFPVGGCCGTVFVARWLGLSIFGCFDIGEGWDGWDTRWKISCMYGCIIRIDRIRRGR